MATFQWKLNKLGFRNYAAYLRSPLWQSIRSRAFAQHGCVCLACRNAVAEVVHHTEYSLLTLSGQCIETLQPLCAACHDDIHGRGPDGIDKFQLAKEPKQRSAQVKQPKPPKRKKPKKQKRASADRVATILKNGLNPRAFKLTDKEKQQINRIRTGAVPMPKPDYGAAYCPSCKSRCPKNVIRYTPSGLAICSHCLCAHWASIEDSIEAELGNPAA